MSIATARPAITIAPASARASPRSVQTTASAKATSAVTNPTGCTSAYVPRSHTTCANANVHPPNTASSGTTSNSSASAQIVAEPNAIAIADSAFKRAAGDAIGTACIHSHASIT